MIKYNRDIEYEDASGNCYSVTVRPCHQSLHNVSSTVYRNRFDVCFNTFYEDLKFFQIYFSVTSINDALQNLQENRCI